METLGSRIAFFRNAKRWTQQHLASEIGKSQGALSEIESDLVSPKWDLIMLIAEKLEVPIYSLVPNGGCIITVMITKIMLVLTESYINITTTMMTL